MANGYKSLHPLTEQALRNLGIKSADVTQGYGNAKASAGYHAIVGACDGRKFSHCVDLTADLIGKETMLKLWEAGFVAFARIQGKGWSGSSHIHMIHLGLTADDGQAHLLNGPRQQVVDFLKQPALNGLVGHSRLTDYVPPISLQADLRRQYSKWLPDYPTRVLAPGGQQINCYAWLEDGSVTVDVEAFCRWWGKPQGWLGLEVGYQEIEKRGGSYSFGRFNRATVRQLAECMGLKIAGYKFEPQKRWATVEVGYA